MSTIGTPNYHCRPDSEVNAKPRVQTIGEMMDELAELRKVSALVRELLAILDAVEETDEGREFHPTTIQTCRCMTGKRLDEIFTQLKASLPNAKVCHGQSPLA